MKVHELDLRSQATEDANAIGSLRTEVCDYQRRITQLVSRGTRFQFMSVVLQVICSLRHTKVLESRREIENRSQQLEALSRASKEDQERHLQETTKQARRMRELSDELEHVKSTAHALRNRNSSIETDCASKQKQISELEQRFDKLHLRLQCLEDENGQQRQSANDLNSKIQTYETDIGLLRKKVRETSDEVERQTSALVAERSTAQSTATRLQGMIKQLRKELRTANEMTKTEIEAKELMSRSVEALQKSHKEAQDDIEQLRRNHLAQLCSMKTIVQFMVGCPGYDELDLVAMGQTWLNLRALSDLLGDPPLQQDSISFIHGLTVVKVAELSQPHVARLKEPPLMQAMTLFITAHSSPFRLSATSVQLMSDALSKADDHTLRQCLPVLYGTIHRICSRPKVTYAGSLILLQLFELLGACLISHPEPRAMVQELFRKTRAELCLGSLLVRSIDRLVCEMLEGHRPELGELIIDLANEAGTLARADDFSVSMDGENLLLVSPDREVGIARPPHFRIDLRRGPRFPELIFDDAPLVGNCTLSIEVVGNPVTAMDRSFRACFDRYEDRYSPEDRLQVEMIDS
jgi:predicted nuclease with TOPRIM domain